MPTDLRCEQLVDPIGVGTATPRLSWRLSSSDATDGPAGVVAPTGIEQGAARVTVGLEGDAEPLWDSGTVDGWRMHLRYDGPPLASRQRCWWTVRTWCTHDGDRSNRHESVGPTAHFEVGLLEGGDWEAVMIRPAAGVASAAVRFTTSFERPDGVGDGAHPDVTCARLHLSAHGVVAAWLNGEEVSDEVLSPGWTSYHHRLVARTHDVGAHLLPGTNRLSLVVAPGWFSGRLGLEGARGLYGDHLGVLAQLEVLRADGTRQVVATGERAWTAEPTGWLQAELYDGETFDARADRAGATGTARSGVGVAEVPLDLDEVLVGAPCPPVRRVATLRPAAVERLEDGTLTVDVGQNISGWLRLGLGGLAEGTEITLRHAEVLDPEGRLFTAPLRTASATDRFVASGAPDERYEPRFTFHGFRYAEITGIPEGAPYEVEAVAISSDLERTGTFECSDPLVNRLHDNVVWSWRDNSVSVPTDCPQRDERLGWTGDIQVFAPTACFLFDVEAFLANWLADLRAEQSEDGTVPGVVPDVGSTMDFVAGLAGWGDAAAVVPWVLYEHYGDETVLADSLGSMTAWVERVQSLLGDDGVWRHPFQFGDWLDPDAPHDRPWQAKASAELVATAYVARSTELLARSAAVLGDDALAATHAGRLAEVRAAWWLHFGDEALTSQTGCAMALQFDLAPDSATRRALGDRLAELVHEADDHLGTGFLGTPLLLEALSAAGHHDVACAVLAQDTQPSWLYEVRAGATTVWERWDALQPDGTVVVEELDGVGASMVSFNHYAFGSVAEWLHRRLLGLRPDPDDPGYHHVLVEPMPCARITSASGSLRTRFGELRLAWQHTARTLEVVLDVPPNAWATVRLPGRDPRTLGSGHWELRSG